MLLELMEIVVVVSLILATASLIDAIRSHRKLREIEKETERLQNKK